MSESGKHQPFSGHCRFHGMVSTLLSRADLYTFASKDEIFQNTTQGLLNPCSATVLVSNFLQELQITDNILIWKAWVSCLSCPEDASQGFNLYAKSSKLFFAAVSFFMFHPTDVKFGTLLLK